MADDDEIDVLSDFSFNSCFAQNNQGIPSCSNREDTVHPQWLLDSTVTNWYDNPIKDNNRTKDGTSRKLSGDGSVNTKIVDKATKWSKEERELLLKEMAKYGRNVWKISQTIKTKTEADIQVLIEAEYGVNLDTPLFGLDKQAHDDILVVQEEIVTDETSVVNEILKANKRIRTKKKVMVKSKNSLLRPDALFDKSDTLKINPSEIIYDDDLIVGSTESIGSDIDSTDIVANNLVQPKEGKAKAVKKIGNHRRKVSRNYDKQTRNRSAEALNSSKGRCRKDSAKSEDGLKSHVMQIVLGSGQALPLSEGEQVIKIEKKKDSDPESDIDIDVDSDIGGNDCKQKMPVLVGEPVIVAARKFEPMRKRKKKINLDGGGGCTIMHTENGDLYEISSEPRKERAPKKQAIHLIPCRFYNAEKPAPFTVKLNVSALVAMDAHAHSSRGEVCGLVGGALWGAGGGGPPDLELAVYRACAAAASRTHCDMDPVSAAAASEYLSGAGAGWRVSGWHHSHPAHGAQPSATDLRSQRALQLGSAHTPPQPCVALITSQRWPAGRTASLYKCIRVEEDPDSVSSDDVPVGYQLSVKLEPDITADNMASVLQELRLVLRDETYRDELSVDMMKDVCPYANLTYMEKLISSVSHHMRSAGYEDNDPVKEQFIQGIRDVFR